MMKLFLITQDELTDEAYDSAVVSAESEDDARIMHPASGDDIRKNKHWSDSENWPNDPTKITVECIGEYFGTEKKVVCASYVCEIWE